MCFSIPYIYNSQSSQRIEFGNDSLSCVFQCTTSFHISYSYFLFWVWFCVNFHSPLEPFLLLLPFLFLLLLLLLFLLLHPLVNPWYEARHQIEGGLLRVGAKRRGSTSIMGNNLTVKPCPPHNWTLQCTLPKRKNAKLVRNCRQTLQKM